MAPTYPGTVHIALRFVLTDTCMADREQLLLLPVVSFALLMVHSASIFICRGVAPLSMI